MTGDTANMQSVHPLDALSAQAGDMGGPAAAGQAPAEAAEEAASLAALEAGAAKVVLMILKVGRAMLAKRLPEIVTEWPDALLTPPAEAAVPLLKKHMAGLMRMAASSPETAALVVSCIPLLMGLLAAIDKADKAAKKDRSDKTPAVTVNAT